MDNEITRLRRRIHVLKDALRRYGDHDSLFCTPGSCVCGFENALAGRDLPGNLTLAERQARDGAAAEAG